MLQVKDQFGNFKTDNFAELRMKAFGATDSGEPKAANGKAANGIEQAPARCVCAGVCLSTCSYLLRQQPCWAGWLSQPFLGPNDMGALVSTLRHVMLQQQTMSPALLTVLQGVHPHQVLWWRQPQAQEAGMAKRRGPPCATT